MHDTDAHNDQPIRSIDDIDDDVLDADPLDPPHSIAREAVRYRDHRLCRVCGDRPEDRRIDTHHIDPDGPTEPHNLISLCRWCHQRFEGEWTNATPDEFARRAQEEIEEATEASIGEPDVDEAASEEDSE